MMLLLVAIYDMAELFSLLESRHKSTGDAF